MRAAVERFLRCFGAAAPRRLRRARLRQPRFARRRSASSGRPCCASSATAGFTLAEMLLAVALVGLLTSAVAVGIGAAVNAYGNIREASDAQAVLNNATTAVIDELRFAYGVEEVSGASGVGGKPAYAFNSTVRDYRLYLSNGTPDSAEGAIVITLNPANALATGDAVAAEQPIALPLANTASGDSSSATRFCAQLTELEWHAGPDPYWTFGIKVVDEAAAGSLDAPAQAEIANMTVRPVNSW